MKSFAPELDAKIRHLMRDCGQQAAQMATQQFQVALKGPADYVTSVDRWLDRQLGDAFATLFPQDGAISEENERSRAAFHAGYRRLWAIDPLDGTEDFILGRPHYAVMVGLLEDGAPAAGWIYAPAKDELYYGGPGWGLFQTTGDAQPHLLPVQEPPPPSASFCPVIVGTRDEQNFGAAIKERIPEAQFYCLGSFGLKVLEVICGRAGLYIYMNKRVKLWDTAGPIALAKAAGLVCSDLEGNPLSFQPDAIAPDTLVHQQTIAIGWPSYIEALRSRVLEAVLAAATD